MSEESGGGRRIKVVEPDGSEPARSRGHLGEPAPGHVAGDGRGSRQAVLRISHVEPWSITRVAFAVSCAMAIVFVVAAIVFWIVMKITGVWGLVDDALTSVLSDGSQNFDIGNYFGLWRLLIFTVVLSATNIFLMTALAALGARLYNAVADLVGGVQVTFTDD